MPLLILACLGSGSVPRIPLQDRDTLGFPGWFVWLCRYPPRWADLCGVLSSPSLRHQRGHHHNTLHARTLSEETHSSSPRDGLQFHQWSNPFLRDRCIMMYGKTRWRRADRQTDRQADRLMLQYVSVCVGSFWLWRMMMMESRPHPIKRCGPLKLWAYSRFRRRMWSQTGSRSSNWTFLFLQRQNEFRV